VSGYAGRQEEQPSPLAGPPTEFGEHIPPRNRHFIGRTAELQSLHGRLITPENGTANRPPQPLTGTGGIGKTAIAVEYAYRYADFYDLIWWIHAEGAQPIRGSFANLSRRLHLNTSDSAEAISAVRRTLLEGRPYAKWLLIFDDATNPVTVTEFLPRTTPYGHVIITSQIQNWDTATYAEPIKVGEFAEQESLDFLRRWVKILAPMAGSGQDAVRAAEIDAQRIDDARRLADKLDHLPLLEVHAAAYLNETGATVDEYLQRYDDDAYRLLSTDETIDYPRVAAQAWKVSTDALEPHERALFDLCSFFSPEGIAQELLIAVGKGLDLPAEIRRVLGDLHELREAERRLARFSLVTLNAVRNTVEMHKVVQKVAKDLLSQVNPEAADTYRRIVHALLAASNPGNPEQDAYDDQYDWSLPHLEPTGAIYSDDKAVRDLIIDQVTRLRLRGGHVESIRLAEPALKHWSSATGPDDIQVLALATQLGMALRLVERHREAEELNEETLRRLRVHYGEKRLTTMICANSHGADLRSQGRFTDALANDLALLQLHEEAHGLENPHALDVINNIGVDYRRLGDFEEALAYDLRALESRSGLGPTRMDTLHSMGAVSHDLRELGRYDESLEYARRATTSFEARRGGENVSALDARKRFAVALRRVGSLTDAREVAVDAYNRYVAYNGEEHRHTLTAATCLINDYRLTGDLEHAYRLGKRTVGALATRHPTHSTTFAAQVNYAIVCRLCGEPSKAFELDEAALAGLRNLFGERHPFALSAMTNLASDLAVIGETTQARELGERGLDACREFRGVDHPATLAAAANLTIDLRATGAHEKAQELLDDTLGRYNATLGSGHPEARRAAQRGRLDVDIEPF